jgi:integrase
MQNRSKRSKLTEASVRDLPLAESGKYVVRDIELKGFMVVISKKAKSWAVQRDLWQGPRGNRRLVKSVRHTLGRVGAMPLRVAREKAFEVISLIQQGIDPNHQEPVQDLTLGRAWDDYAQAMISRGRQERSIEDFRYNLRYFSDWFDLTLMEIGGNRAHVRERHKVLTRNNGPYAANRAMRALRAAYNLALKVDDELPANPVVAVIFNKEERRETVISPDDLPNWWARVCALSNPIRRDLHLFLMLTGMRRTAAVTARWEHVNWDAKQLLVPNPKGGKGRSFLLPLSKFVVDMLARRRDENEVGYPKSPWIWPSDSSKGHVTEPKETKNGLPQPHVLRHSYSTFAKAAGLHEADIALLLNHKLPGVTGGYIHGHAISEHLAKCQESVTEHILQFAGE